MKRITAVIILLMLLTACGKSEFGVTENTRKHMTITAVNADKDDFFIRKVEATKKSNIRLYYYDLAKGKEAIIEINRRPGLCLTFRSGTKPGLRCDVYSFCTRENMLRFISFGRIHDVV